MESGQGEQIGGQGVHGGRVGGPAGAEADYGAAIVQRFPEGEGILFLQMCLLLPGQDWELLVGVGGEVEGEAPPEAGLPDAQGLLHTVAAQLPV